MKSTASIKRLGGMPILVPNVILSSSAYHYISYNNRDIGYYGSDTTAIVVTAFYRCPKKRKSIRYGTVFLLLNGEHPELVGKDLLSCLEYFSKNEHVINEHSDTLESYLNYKPFDIFNP